MIEVKTQLIWNGNKVKQTLINRVKKNLRVAGETYYLGILASIQKWGSIPIGSNLRKLVDTSSPGDPPLRQTGELYNATKLMVGQTTPDQFVAEISNEAEHAETLEFGGNVQIGNNRPHTSIRLVNPPKHVNYIAPRPVWLPLFNKIAQQLINIIKS